mgnify:CR=1 FL=1
MDTPKNEKFRDSIATVNNEGKRSWVFPKKPSGKFYKYRSYVSYFLLVFLLFRDSNVDSRIMLEEFQLLPTLSPADDPLYL